MVLVRIAYVADLPTPDEAIRALDGNGSGGQPQGNGGGAAAGTGPSAAAGASPPVAQRYEAPRGGARAMAAPQARPSAEARPAELPQAAPVRAIATFQEVVALAVEKRDLQTKTALERDVRLVRCEDGRLEIALEAGAARSLVNDLSRKLSQWTGRPWLVVVSAEAGAATLKSQNDTRRAEFESGVRADPLVKAVLERFPGAEIVGVKEPGDAAPEPLPLADADLPPGNDEGLGDNWVRDDGND
jgi:DNA polymerase-3 subunit gamma/tau